MGFKENLFSGLFWEGVKKYYGFFLNLGVTAILARILTPEDFGIIALVVAYNGFIQIFTESGISSSVVQKEGLSNDDLSTIFWFSLILGLIFTLVTVLLGPSLETFFGMAGVSLIIQVMSINLLIVALKAVPIGLLRKSLKFKSLMFIQTLSITSSSILAVILALNGIGYWSLVIKSITTNLFAIIPIFVASNFKPQFKFSKRVLKEVLSFSTYVTAFKSINYWSRNVDNILIGKYMTSELLGYYSQAYKLLMMPITILSGVFNPVLHPLFSSIKNDKLRFKTNYLKIVEFISVVSFPLGAFLYFSAEEIIIIMWGSQWIPSIDIFKILVLLTLFQPIISTTGGIFIAIDQEKLLLKIGILNTLFMVTGIVSGLKYGIIGVAIGYTISYLSMVIPYTLYQLKTKLELTWSDIGKSVMSGTILLVVCVIILLILGPIFDYENLVLSLLIKLIAFIIILLPVLFKKYINEIRNMRKFKS